jgi:hypothetical protein
MNRTILVTGFFLVALVFLGSCSDKDDNCLKCPTPKPDTPRISKFLIAASEAPGFLICPDSIVAYSINNELFPAGSEFQIVSLLDSVPPLEDLIQFDAILLYTVGYPIDGDSLGDIMADYVDQGGGLVMCLWSMFDFQAGIKWTLHSPGYAPLKGGPTVGDINDRVIDFASISYPLHPIFYSVDITNITYPGHHNMLYPRVDDTALLLAIDDLTANAIAINATGNIIGLNIWPSLVFFTYFQHPEAAKLIANSLMFTAGLLE